MERNTGDNTNQTQDSEKSPEIGRIPQSGKNPVTWIPSASGDKFPIQIDLNHPLWQTFLESGCLSPTQFFRMFFSPPTYFHNPTPWQSRSSVSLAQRVSELLDSFRPGSISYRPFKKHAKETWIIDSNNNNHDVEPQRHPQPTERPQSQPQPQTGRPRPFYRTTSEAQVGDSNSDPELLHQNPLSLQEILRMHLVKTYGLRRLKELLETSNALPLFIQQLMLTFACTDFEEIKPTSLTESPTTYNVKCLHESGPNSIIYRASFFTSEVDKNVSNLWNEHHENLKVCEKDGVVPVSALATDVLTENVFIITEDHSHVQTFEPKKLEKFIVKVKTALEGASPNLEISKNLRENLLETSNQEILMQNPLLIKKRNLCQNMDEKLQTLQKLLDEIR